MDPSINQANTYFISPTILYQGLSQDLIEAPVSLFVRRVGMVRVDTLRLIPRRPTPIEEFSKR
jgi:hypothetical protein